MKYTISFALSLFIFISIYAQKRQAVFAGAGVGLDHGGLGLKVEYQPFKYLGLFGGVGHNLVGFNGNGGLLLVPLRHGGFYWARNYIIQNGGTIKQDVYPVLLAAGWNINLLDL